MDEAKDTVFGKEHNFGHMLGQEQVEEHFRQIPFAGYMEMKPYWQRAYEGENDVSWPGGVSYFAMSSGTTDSASKYIPVTDMMLKCVKRAGIRQLMQIAKSDFPKDYLAKNYLFVGGSTDLEFNGNNFSGDLSGITTGNLPLWLQRFSKPEPHIKSQKEWDHKINMMVESAPSWDISMIAGVPAWVQILFERIIERYKVDTIHDVWPNLSVYVHGGVSFKPYKAGFQRYLSRDLKYFETYLASEGFIAFQTHENNRGMRLVFKNGIYYELVPFNELNFDENGVIRENAQAVGLQDISENIDYAIVISTCSGAWRYLLGDTIRFVNAEKCEIEITGRTKHFLSLCGEHLSVDNMNVGVQYVASHFGVNFTEYTVKGLRVGNGFEHHWYLACDSELNPEEVKQCLDKRLCEINDDYRVERKHALQDIKVYLLPRSTFIEWMNSRGKLGAQNKFPRVMNDQLYTSWKQHIQAELSAT